MGTRATFRGWAGWLRWPPAGAVLLGWLWPALACGQAGVTLRVVRTDTSAPPPALRYDRHHPDSAAARREVARLVDWLRQRAYLTASADSLRTHGDTLTAWLHVGAAYRLTITPGNVPPDPLHAVRLPTRRPLTYADWEKRAAQLLAHAEDHGYPFATVRLDSFAVLVDQATARVQYDAGPYIRFDTLVLTGGALVKPRFLATYLHLPPGQPFSQVRLRQANQRLAQLPFLKLNQPVVARFANDRAYPRVDATPRKTNQFDGIIGFLPNELAPGRLLVTGEVKLRLENLFGTGKSLRLWWQQIRPSSPVLQVAYSQPTLLGTRLEVGATFELLRQDTTFLNVVQRLQLAYPLGTAGKVSASVGVRSSRLGSSGQFRDATTLPVLADVRYVSSGLGYDWNTLDDDRYPRRGTRLHLLAELGNKQVLRNPFVNPVLYEGVAMNAAQATLGLRAQRYLPLGRQSVLLLGGQAGHVGSTNLFGNDLFRLGGLNSLRGFNENAFFASSYAVGTVEYRFFTDASSYLLVFYDQGWLATRTVRGTPTDAPSGGGAGIHFQTRAGAFSLLYALGRSATQPFGFNYSRIHFGYVSVF